MISGVESALGRSADAWITAAASAPRRALALLAVLIGLAILAATGIRVNTDSSGMLAADLPFQIRAREIVEAFPATKNAIVVVVRSENASAADAAAADVAARLEGETEAIRRVFAPASDPFFLREGLLYEETGELESRLSRLSQSANLIATLRADPTTEGFVSALGSAAALAEKAEIEPERLAPLFAAAARTFEGAAAGDPPPFDWIGAFGDAPDGRVLRVVAAEPEFDYARLNPARPAIDAARAAAEAAGAAAGPEVEIGVTGDPVLRGEELHSVQSRLAMSFGLSFLLVAAVLAVSLRSVGRVALALGCVLATVALTAGFSRVTGPLNLISIAFVVLMVGLGIDFAIHLLAHLQERTRRGVDARAALASSGHEIGGALALSAATTAAAFLAFSGTDFVGMAQLGVIGAAGVVIALAVAFTAIPAATALAPGLAGRAGPDRSRTDAPAGAPAGVRRAVAAAALAIGLAALVFAPSARFDADPMSLRSPDAPSVVAQGWIAADPDRQPMRMSLIVGSAEEALAAKSALLASPEVRSAVWLGDLVPKDQEEKLALVDLAWPAIQHAVEGDPVEIAQPDGIALVERLRALGGAEAERLARALDAWNGEGATALDAALFRFFPPLIDRLRAQLDVAGVAEADLPAALAERYRAPDGRLRIEIAPERDISDPAARAAFVDAVAAIAPEAGGPPAQIEGAARAVSAAMLQAVGVAFAATALLAWLTLRRVRPVLAVMVPLLLAGAVTLAASALLDLPFNYANIVVLPLMVGIGVDAGVHLTMRTLRSGEDVYRTSTPRAVLASALTTIAAFGTLGLSEHPGTASMGVMLTLSMTVSVAMIFALTPALARR